MLTPRQRSILKIIVGDYISSAVPVPSHTIAARSDLRVSPATVRNEMAELEEGGYILRRHISSGRIPSNRGYRQFVASIAQEPTLAGDEARRVHREFRQAVEDVELWSVVAAELLSSLVGNVAVVSPPRAAQSRVKRLDVVLLQETLALLVLVLQQAKTKKRLLHLESAATQDELNALSNRLSAVYGGATRQAIAAPEGGASPLERQVVGAAREILMDEDAGRSEEPAVHGLGYFLGQPEFVEGGKASALVDLIEDRRFLKQFLPRLLAGDQVRVAIGDEIEAGELHECSLVVSQYGAAEKASGFVAVIGPTRMPYERSIASVRLLSSAMTELVESLS